MTRKLLVDYYRKYKKPPFVFSEEKAIINSVVKLPPNNQIKELQKRAKNLKLSVNWNDLDAVAHDRAFTVAKVNNADMLQTILDALVDARKSGKNLKQFQSSAKKLLEDKGFTSLKPYRLATIYRTNVMIAYQKEKYEQSQRLGKSGLKPYIKYLPSTSNERNDLHKQFYDLIFRYDDPFWDNYWPPSRFGCQCSTRPLSEKEFKAEGGNLTSGSTLINQLGKKSDFKKQIVDTEKSGLRISKEWSPDTNKYSPALKKVLDKVLDDHQGYDKYNGIRARDVIFENELLEPYLRYRRNLDKLTEDSLNFYKGDGYIQINKDLRNLKPNIVADKIIENAFTYKLENDTKLYRGVSYLYKSDDKNLLKKPLKLFKGLNNRIQIGSFYDFGISSTSTSFKTSNDYARVDDGNYNSVLLEINVKKGTKVAFGVNQENEIMLAPNSRFKIIGSRAEYNKDSGAKVIYCEVILLD